MIIGDLTQDEIEKLEEQAEAALNVDELLVAATRMSRGHGFKWVSYHHYPDIGDFNFSHQVDITHDGVPQSWLDYYLEHFSEMKDPIISLVLETGEAYFFSDCLEHYAAQGDVDSVKYCEAVIKNLGDGVAVPVYGQKRRRGYFGLGAGAGNSVEKSAKFRHHVENLANLIHRKYISLLSHQFRDVKVSPRERDIINHMAHGKSNREIAEVCEISVHTVNGHVRNLLLKFDTTERLTAVLRALTLDIVD